MFFTDKKEVMVYFCHEQLANGHIFVASISAHNLIALLHRLQNEYSDHLPIHSVAESYHLVVPTQLDAESIQLIEEIHDRIEQLQKRGVRIRTIREALLPYQKLSHLLITKDYRLYLQDYANLEVKLKPMDKTVYLLFLYHPEGITLKQMNNHRQELIDLYTCIEPHANPQRLQKSINNLCSPMSNSLNEKISHIRHTLSSILDENLLPHYSITGTRGETFRITLPTNFIVKEP